MSFGGESNWTSVVNQSLRESKRNIHLINQKNAILSRSSDYPLREQPQFSPRFDRSFYNETASSSSSRNFFDTQASDARFQQIMNGSNSSNYLHDQRIDGLRNERKDSLFDQRKDSVNQDLLQSLAQRLSELENMKSSTMKYQASSVPFSHPVPQPGAIVPQDRINLENKLNALEQTLSLFQLKVDQQSNELKENKKSYDFLHSLFIKQSEEIDFLKREVDVRRSTSLKAENAVRQHENWQGGIESELSNLKQSFRSFDRRGKDHEELLQTVLLRSDLDSGVYFDRVVKSVSSTVMSQLSSWRNNVEKGLSNTSTIPALTSGQPTPPDSNSGLDESKLNAYIDAQILKALGLKLHTLHNELEEQIFNKTLFEVRNDLKRTHTEVLERFQQNATENENTSYSSSSPLRLLEQSVQELELKVTDIVFNLQTLQSHCETHQRNIQLEVSALSSQVEHLFESNETILTSARERASGLEALVRTSDVQCKDFIVKAVNEMRDEARQHVNSANDEQRVLEKRVNGVEKLMEMVIASQAESKKALSASIAASPEVKKIQTLADNMDKVNAALHTLQIEAVSGGERVEDMLDRMTRGEEQVREDINQQRESLAHLKDEVC